MKTYALAELLALKNEWLDTLSDVPDSWYGSKWEIYSDAMTAFLGWLNIKENTP